MPIVIALVLNVEDLHTWQEHIFMKSQPEVSMCYTLLGKIITHVEQEETKNEMELAEDILVRKCVSKPQNPDDCCHKPGW